MRKGNEYLHFKNNKYMFLRIVLPVSEFTGNPETLKPVENHLVYDANTPEGEEPRQVQLYEHDGLFLVHKETAHVLYQAEKDYGTSKVWIREVDDFFGYKEQGNGELIKRFSLISKN